MGYRPVRQNPACVWRVRGCRDPLEDPRRKGSPRFFDCYEDFVHQTDKIEIRGRATIQTIEPYLCNTTIGFPAIVPDVYRADQFIRELKKFESEGELPNLMIMLLPNDHTTGTRPHLPTPEAAVADNDLARSGCRGSEPQQVLAGHRDFRGAG